MTIRGLASASLFVLFASTSSVALAQSDADDTSAAAAESQGEEIVVTGRAGAGDRTRIETSYAVTSIDNDTLRSRAPSSVSRIRACRARSSLSQSVK